MTATRAEENITDFSFESVLFQSDRLFETLELSSSVTDLDIFEHINKPYLTAVIAFTDSRNFIAGVDILGAERITINLKSNRRDTETIQKIFYIDTVQINHKVNDNNSYVVLHLIEDIGYISNLQNVNRSYTGKCTEIVQKIGQNFLEKEVYSTETDKQTIKVVVPNLNPLHAMQWITKRASTVDGYPFYLYSTLVGEKLKFADLGTLLSQPPLNTDIPYRYWQGASQSGDRDIQRRTIKEYQQENTEDLFSLISRGCVGAEYEYIDTTLNKRNIFHFDVTKDLLGPIVSKGVLSKNTGNVMYSPDYVYNDTSFNELDSKRITHIGGSSAFYLSEDRKTNSYRESEALADYKLNVISKAMHEFLQKAPMQITLNGLDFIDGDINTATGNIIRLEYLKSQPEEESTDLLDPKKSGDYLIIATQYMFKRETVDVRLSCAKLGNLRL